MLGPVLRAGRLWDTPKRFSQQLRGLNPPIKLCVLLTPEVYVDWGYPLLNVRPAIVSPNSGNYPGELALTPLHLSCLPHPPTRNSTLLGSGLSPHSGEGQWGFRMPTHCTFPWSGSSLLESGHQIASSKRHALGLVPDKPKGTSTEKLKPTKLIEYWLSLAQIWDLWHSDPNQFRKTQAKWKWCRVIFSLLPLLQLPLYLASNLTSISPL